MEIAVMAGLFAKRDVDVDASHKDQKNCLVKEVLIKAVKLLQI